MKGASGMLIPLTRMFWFGSGFIYAQINLNQYIGQDKEDGFGILS